MQLTNREQEWHDRARRALKNEEKWESCDDCRSYHPVGFEGDCDELENRLPAKPADILS